MSKSSPVIPRLQFHQRIGEILCCAGLISQAQVELTLRDQQEHLEILFGEILALRGWLRQETADFFAEQWQELLRETPKDRIGSYLQQAGLLGEEQVATILAEQKRTGYKFGALAVLNGWIKQQTLDFFLVSLYPRQQTGAPFIRRSRDQLHNKQAAPSNKQPTPSNKQPAPLFIHLSDDPENPSASSPLKKGKDTTIPWID
ncbi:MAG: hypothetical protein KTR27_16970 [Leptolyngbyaceae cyanobacterium MAG.088]|nr:hypothetical protein [Leptolyngbyaceae cyanobacterium MAG.088]